jgi:hypothetical protein
MAVTISILASVCAGLIITIILQHLRNDKLVSLAKENKDRIKQLESELKDLTEKYRIAEEYCEKQKNKKPSNRLDLTGVYMR